MGSQYERISSEIESFLKKGYRVLMLAKASNGYGEECRPVYNESGAAGLE